MDSQPFAILRTAKHATSGAIKGRAVHHLRATPPANADAERTPDNVILAGPDTARELAAEIDAATKSIAGRKDAVRCIEILLAASPEHWKAGGDWAAFGDRAMDWLRATFGEKNIRGAGLHLDETSPHVWAMVTPIDTDGKLRAKRWLGGAERMIRLQDSWAKAVADLGLRRGVRKSKARHITIRDYYAAAAGDQGAHRRVTAEASRREEDALRRAEEAEAKARQAQEELARLEADRIKVQRCTLVAPADPRARARPPRAGNRGDDHRRATACRGAGPQAARRVRRARGRAETADR